MAPVHPRGHATPTLIAGAAAQDLAATLAGAGFACEVAGDAPGEATAVKMVRSLFVKGLEAITVEACLAAEASGCYDRVMDSLASSYPGLDWPDNVAYNFERTLRHGARRAAEMRESAATLDGLGLGGASGARNRRNSGADGRAAHGWRSRHAAAGNGAGGAGVADEAVTRAHGGSRSVPVTELSRGHDVICTTNMFGGIPSDLAPELAQTRPRGKLELGQWRRRSTVVADGTSPFPG